MLCQLQYLNLKYIKSYYAKKNRLIVGFFSIYILIT